MILRSWLPVATIAIVFFGCRPPQTSQAVAAPSTDGSYIDEPSQNQHVARSNPSCRRSTLQDEWQPNTENGTETQSGAVDVDGDGKADVFLAERGTGSGYSTSSVELHLSSTGLVITTGTETSFSSILSTHVVPTELHDPELVRARELVEKLLFETICDKPDPSLQHLLVPDSPKWNAGPPYLPGNYAVFSRESGQAVWLEYLGANHRRNRERRLSGSLRETDRNNDLSLQVSAHGVVIVDEKSNQFAWLFVSRGRGKLRHASVVDASFEDDGTNIQITLIPSGNDNEPDQLRVPTPTI